MKHSILLRTLSLITVLTILQGCTPSPPTQSNTPGNPTGSGPLDPNSSKPSFPGKPGDFNGNWKGKGTLHNSVSKSTMEGIYTVTLSQNIDAASGLPVDIVATITMTDSIGDVVYSALLTGFFIKERSVDKTTIIYEIFETKTKNKVGEIGEHAFALHHSITGRLINIDVNLTSMTLSGFKIVGKAKTTFMATLKEVP